MMKIVIAMCAEKALIAINLILASIDSEVYIDRLSLFIIALIKGFTVNRQILRV